MKIFVFGDSFAADPVGWARMLKGEISNFAENGIGEYKIYKSLQTFLNFDKDTAYKFESKEALSFHKKYTKKLHHIRWIGAKRDKLSDYLFSEITPFKKNKKNILFHGDSWSALLTDPDFFMVSQKVLLKNFQKTII